jgi:DNA-binding response OmpR family regulator
LTAADTPVHPEIRVGGNAIRNRNPNRSHTKFLTLPQRIDSKAMEVLLCLARAAPEVVSQVRLLECVWPYVVVSDNAVHQAVAHLRNALGNDARSPHCIENIQVSVERQRHRSTASSRFTTPTRPTPIPHPA